jgi:hypothetical protein
MFCYEYTRVCSVQAKATSHPLTMPALLTKEAVFLWGEKRVPAAGSGILFQGAGWMIIM